MSVILYGLDGQFFEFNNSSLVCCFVSLMVPCLLVKKWLHDVLLQLRTIFLAVGFTISFGAVLVRATSDVIEHYVRMVQFVNSFSVVEVLASLYMLVAL